MEGACRTYHTGWTPANEKLPRLLLKSMTDAGQNGVVPDMDVLLDEYYAACGWHRPTGHPLPAKLRTMG